MAQAPCRLLRSFAQALTRRCHDNVGTTSERRVRIGLWVETWLNLLTIGGKYWRCRISGPTVSRPRAGRMLLTGRLINLTPIQCYVRFGTMVPLRSRMPCCIAVPAINAGNPSSGHHHLTAGAAQAFGAYVTVASISVRMRSSDTCSYSYADVDS
jgi:hypothetical protein